jgi:hypothetical protein
MQRRSPILEYVLAEERENLMVRHQVSRCSFAYRRINVASCVRIAQAAGAMGSISSASSFSVLKKYLNESDTNRSVRETCEIAIAKVKWDHSEGQRHLASTTT